MSGTLEITVEVPCVNGCRFCPQGKLRKLYTDDQKSMTYDNFVKILDTVPTDVRVDWSGFCEPFQNRNVSAMMKYAAKKGHPMVLYTTLAGFGLTQLSDLIDVKFDLIMIHIPDEENGYSVEYESNFINALDVFRNVYNENEIQYMAMGKVSDVIKQHIDPVKIQYPTMLSRGSNNLDMDVPKKNGSVRCTIASKDFDHNVVLPNGDVYLCCMDYSLEHKLGNLIETSYDEIVLGEALNGIKYSAENGGDILCRKCEWGGICE